MSPHTSRRHADTSQKQPSGVYREDPADIKTIIWASIWTLLGFKIVTSIIILIAFPTTDAFWMVMALSAPWIFGGLFYYGFFGRIRPGMVRMRARRKKLIHQEWNVD